MKAPLTPPLSRREREPLIKTRVVGRPYAKVDAAAKVTGQTKFADDVMLPRMLHCKLLRSKIAHARIVSIDVSRALAAPGVVAVATGRDLPIPFGILPVSQDEHALCTDRVRFVGDPVAAIAAVDEDAAFDALDLIDVRYEALPPIGTIDDGLAAAATPIHDYGDAGNIHKLVSMEFGDTEEGFSRADRVYDNLYFYEGNTHLPLEQHAAVADFGPDGKLTLWSSTQTPHYVHRALAKVLGHAAGEDPRHRDAQRRRLRREVGPVQSRDRRGAPLARDGPARQDLPDARGGLLLSPRPASDAHAREDRGEEGRRDHGAPLPDDPRRRRLRLVRRRFDVLHGRAADGDVPGADVPLRRRARLHEQAPVRPQARPRHAAAALRARGRARPDRVRPRHRPGRDPARPPAARELAHGELPARRIDRPRRLHRQGRRGLRLEEAPRQAPAGARPRPRLLVVPVRRGAADLLEHHAAVGGAAEGRPRRGSHRVLRLDGHRPGLRLDPRLDRRGGARDRSLRHPHRHGRHGPDAGGPRLVLLACHADDRQRRHPGGRAHEADDRRGGGREARDPGRAGRPRRRPRVRRREPGERG